MKSRYQTFQGFVLGVLLFVGQVVVPRVVEYTAK
jgi:hypothetical protein